jgi:uncharacterized protein (TIGR02246 family)
VPSHTLGVRDSWSNEEDEVRAIYWNLLDCWNRRNADAFAALFAADGNPIGFDGSPMNGRAEIESALRQIFADHLTASYVAIVRGVRFLTPDVAVLRAVAGMVPPCRSDLNPAVNAVQTLVAAKQDGRWRIAIFQNTPAAFHGRPHLNCNSRRNCGKPSAPRSFIGHRGPTPVLRGISDGWRGRWAIECTLV